MDTKQERALVERQESLRSLRSDMHRKLEDTSALALDYCTTNRLLEVIPKDLNNMSSFRDLHGISSRPLPRDLYDDSEDPGNESAADVMKSTGSKKGKGVRDRMKEENERMNVISDMDPSTLHRVVLALGIPPLPPRLGFSKSLLDDRNESTDKATKLNKEWRPKVNKYGGVVVATLNEHCLTDKPRLMSKTDAHSGAVNRICVSQDQSFFVTASNDGTARVWGTSQLDQTVTPKAAAIYKQQKGRILDACMVDSTHSVCSASDQGSVHVWRVELAGEKKTQTVRQVDKFEEGPVLTTFYYSTDHASMLLYGTQRGFIHGWDLRSDSEPWRGGGLNVPPELGFLTSTSVGTDKNWLCVGTSRGFILLWDLRFRLLVKLWRHSSHGPIYRLATCARLPGESESSSPGPLAFVAAANNEIAVWNLSTGGKCLRCFRSLSPQDTKDPTAMMPELEEHKIPTHPLTPIFNASQQLDMLREQKKMVPTHSVRAIMGRINSSEKKNSFVMTGSTDRHIRFWDFNTPAKCFTISGLEPGQPRPAYDSIPIRTNLETKLIVCYDAEVPSADNVVPSHLPIREQRGIHCATTSHGDAILDLKSVDLPRRMLLSSSRDGVVKCWR